MRLTRGMLRAMMQALFELGAGDYPQGMDEHAAEAAKLMVDAVKAQDWIYEELERRDASACYRRKLKAKG